MRFSQTMPAAALAACVLTLALPSSVAADEHGEDGADEVVDMTEGEEKLAKILKGREAGEPVSCISGARVRSSFKIIDETALVYGRGNTIYVNYTKRPKDIDDWDTIVSRRFGSQICKTDIVTKVDRSTGIFSGNIFLSDFIPYRRVKKDKES